MYGDMGYTCYTCVLSIHAHWPVVEPERMYCNAESKFERKILQTLAGFQFDFDLLLLGFHPEPGPLGAIPGQWPGRAIDRLVIRDRARKQPIFTGRKVVECETPIISRQHFGITQNLICKSAIDRR